MCVVVPTTNTPLPRGKNNKKGEGSLLGQEEEDFFDLLFAVVLGRRRHERPKN